MKILITSALPYVNNVPHLGNIIGCVLSADVYARYCRSKGHDCMYICGTDEYGTATEIKAIEEKVTPQEVCDKYYAIHKDIYEWFGIRFDIFGRTSTPKHEQITHDIFSHLYNNGYIVEGEVEQLYDETAGMSLADRYIEGTCPYCSYEGARGDQCDKCGKLLHPEELKNPVSKITKTAPVMKKTKHLFINLPGIEKELGGWIERASREGFWSENSIKIAQSWLREGLKKRAITRDLKWGVPVPLPGYKGKVFYVWFDAPIGYISITANLTDNWKGWWMNPEEIRLFQFMGKDNVPFHTVIFPSTLMGTKQNWTLLHHISTTEFLNYEDGKFSKSRHVGVFGDDAMKSGIPPDVWRYYLLYNRPEKSDTEFTWDDFADKTNNELLANVGNLVNRTLVFIKNNFEGRIPGGELNEEEKKFLEDQDGIAKEVGDELEKVQIKDGLHRIMHFSKNANRFFQDKRPWELVKTDQERAGAVMNVLARQVRDLSILIEPYLPHTAAEIAEQLNRPLGRWNDLGKPLGSLEIGQPRPLFKKIEKHQIEQFRKEFGGKKAETVEAEAGFRDLDLEVGQIIKAVKHPNAEKLLVETVKMGDGIRQIVSGIAEHYLPEELEGRKVIILKNIKTAKLRGVESHGMLLVAEGREKEPPHEGKAGMEKDAVEIIFAESSETGEKVVLKGEQSSPRNLVSFDDFKKIRISVEEFEVVHEGKPVVTASEELRMKNVRKGVVL